MRFNKVLACLGLCAILSFPTLSFADSLSVEYVDLLIDKMESRDDKQRGKLRKDLRISFATENILEHTKNTYTSSLSEANLKELEELGITDEDVKNNLEILKSWSLEDRYKLIDYARNLDKDGIISLNDKYSDSGSSGSTNGGAAGGGAPSVATDNESLDDLKKELVSTLPGLISKEIPTHEKYIYKKFNDTKSHWSNSSVMFFAKRGIVDGRDDGNFYPDDKISKAEIIKIISNVFIEDENKLESKEIGYKDIKSDSWYYNYVQNLSSIGVLEDSDTLNAESYPERQEIIDLMVKTLKSSNIPLGDDIKELSDDFKDKNSIDDQYKESMMIAVDLGIIRGTGNGMLSPKDKVTRAEVMTMTKNLYDYIMKYLN